MKIPHDLSDDCVKILELFLRYESALSDGGFVKVLTPLMLLHACGSSRQVLSNARFLQTNPLPIEGVSHSQQRRWLFHTPSAKAMRSPSGLLDLQEGGS